MNRPILYKTVDKLFHGVMDRKWVPKYFKDRPEMSAALLGGAGTTAVLEITQHAAENIAPQFYNTDFRTLEELCAVGLTAAILYLGARRKLETLAETHPVYTAGMAAVASSAYIVTLADLLMK